MEKKGWVMQIEGGRKNLQQKKIKQERWGFHLFRMVTASHEPRRKIKPTKG